MGVHPGGTPKLTRDTLIDVLRRDGLCVDESSDWRRVFAYYAGTPTYQGGTPIERVELSIARDGTRIMINGHGRVRMTTFGAHGGPFNWQAIVSRVKQRLDALRQQSIARTRERAEAERSIAIAAEATALFEAPALDELGITVHVTADGDRAVRVVLDLPIGTDLMPRLAQLAAVLRAESRQS